MTNYHKYKIGDVAISGDIDPTHSADDDSKRAASFFRVGDGAFIRRSDRQWRYAVVHAVSLKSSPPFITFTVTKEGSTKKVGPKHWGDRLRPLKRRASDPVGSLFRRKSMSKAKSLYSALDKKPMPVDYRHSSSDGGRPVSFNSGMPPCAEVKTSDNESDDTNEPDPNEMMMRKPRPAPKRRESIKDFFMRKLSGEVLNDLATSELDESIEDMKVHEFNRQMTSSINIEGPTISDVDEAPEPVRVEEPEQVPRQRKPNSRRNRGSFTLTTSSLFKNLMKGAVLEDEEAEPVNRRSTVNNLAADDDEDDNAVNQSSNDDAPAPSAKTSKYTPRRTGRSRRATVDAGRPSMDQMKDLRSRRAATARNSKPRSTENTPTASFVIKEAFNHLMEEKKSLAAA